MAASHTAPDLSKYLTRPAVVIDDDDDSDGEIRGSGKGRELDPPKSWPGPNEWVRDDHLAYFDDRLRITSNGRIFCLGNTVAADYNSNKHLHGWPQLFLDGKQSRRLLRAAVEKGGYFPVKFNTDPAATIGSSTGISGSHWVTFIFDFTSKDKVATREFFDPRGRHPSPQLERNINDLITTVRDVMGDIGWTVSDGFRSYTRKHQLGGVQCGVYNMWFTDNRTQGRTFDWFESERFSDEECQALRVGYFRNDPIRCPSPTFDEKPVEDIIEQLRRQLARQQRDAGYVFSVGGERKGEKEEDKEEKAVAVRGGGRKRPAPIGSLERLIAEVPAESTIDASSVSVIQRAIRPMRSIAGVSNSLNALCCYLTTGMLSTLVVPDIIARILAIEQSDATPVVQEMLNFIRQTTEPQADGKKRARAVPGELKDLIMVGGDEAPTEDRPFSRGREGCALDVLDFVEKHLSSVFDDCRFSYDVFKTCDNCVASSSSSKKRKDNTDFVLRLNNLPDECNGSITLPQMLDTAYTQPRADVDLECSVCGERGGVHRAYRFQASPIPTVLLISLGRSNWRVEKEGGGGDEEATSAAPEAEARGEKRAPRPVKRFVAGPASAKPAASPAPARPSGKTATKKKGSKSPSKKETALGKVRIIPSRANVTYPVDGLVVPGLDGATYGLVGGTLYTPKPAHWTFFALSYAEHQGRLVPVVEIRNDARITYELQSEFLSNRGREVAMLFYRLTSPVVPIHGAAPKTVALSCPPSSSSSSSPSSSAALSSPSSSSSSSSSVVFPAAAGGIPSLSLQSRIDHPLASSSSSSSSLPSFPFASLSSSTLAQVISTGSPQTQALALSNLDPLEADRRQSFLYDHNDSPPFSFVYGDHHITDNLNTSSPARTPLSDRRALGSLLDYSNSPTRSPFYVPSSSTAYIQPLSLAFDQFASSPWRIPLTRDNPSYHSASSSSFFSSSSSTLLSVSGDQQQVRGMSLTAGGSGGPTPAAPGAQGQKQETKTKSAKVRSTAASRAFIPQLIGQVPYTADDLTSISQARVKARLLISNSPYILSGVSTAYASFKSFMRAKSSGDISLSSTPGAAFQRKRIPLVPCFYVHGSVHPRIVPDINIKDYLSAEEHGFFFLTPSQSDMPFGGIQSIYPFRFLLSYGLHCLRQLRRDVKHWGEWMASDYKTGGKSARTGKAPARRSVTEKTKEVRLVG